MAEAQVQSAAAVKLPLYSAKREQVGELEVSASVFGRSGGESLLHEAVRMQLANRRAGTAATKTTGLISGGGRKPWRQKGTGRARAGSTRSPLWRHGGMPEDAQGARVDSLLPIPTTEQVLKEEDVILQIGSFPVASDAKILYQGNRVSAVLGFQLAQAGESVPLQVWRDGRQQEVSLPVFPYHADRAAGYQHETLPRYFVYGGLVFTPLSLDYLRTQGRGSTDSSTSELYYELYH